MPSFKAPSSNQLRLFGAGVPIESTEMGQAFLKATQLEAVPALKRKSTESSFQSFKRVRFREDNDEPRDATPPKRIRRSSAPRKLPARKFKPATPFPSQVMRNFTDETMPVRSKHPDSKSKFTFRVPEGHAYKLDESLDHTRPLAGEPPLAMGCDAGEDSVLSQWSQEASMNTSTPSFDSKKSQATSFMMRSDECPVHSSPLVKQGPRDDIMDEVKIEPLDIMCDDFGELYTKMSNQDQDAKMSIDSFRQPSGLPMPDGAMPATVVQQIFAILSSIPKEHQNGMAKMITHYEELVHLYSQVQERMYELEQRERKRELEMYSELRFLHSLIAGGTIREAPGPEIRLGSRAEVVGRA